MWIQREMWSENGIKFTISGKSEEKKKGNIIASESCQFVLKI